MRRRGWIGLLALAFLLAACAGGGGGRTSCQPAQFDAGCTFDSGATFGLALPDLQIGS